MWGTYAVYPSLVPTESASLGCVKITFPSHALLMAFVWKEMGPFHFGKLQGEGKDHCLF